MAILAVTAISSDAEAAGDPADPDHPVNQKVAEYNGEKYTIADAIWAANGSGEPIKMIADYEWQITIPYGNVVTIDLNGHYVYPQDSGNPFFNHGTLVLTNSSPITAVIGGEYTETAISNSGSLTLSPDTASGGIEIHGSVSNDNYEEYYGYEEFINIHDGVSIIGQGTLPALSSINDVASINIYGGSITHIGESVLIDLTEGAVNIYGGTLKGADYQSILTTRDYNNNIVIGTSDSDGPTISGKTNGDYGLFFDELFHTRDNSGAITMYSGSVTQYGNGMLFRCDLSLQGGELVRKISDEIYPMIYAHTGLWIGITIEGACKAPLVQSDGEVMLYENGSVVQKGSGYAIECGGLNTSEGTVKAVGDAILCHGHIEINGDATKPIITSETGYCFVAKDGSFDGGVYNHAENANIVKLDVSLDDNTDIGFDNNCIVNNVPITSLEGPMVSADDIVPTEYTYALESEEAHKNFSLFVFDTGDYRCSVTRESNESTFTALYSSMVNNTKALFDNLDAVAAAFPENDEDIWRMVTLLDYVDEARLTIPTSISINLAGFSIDSLIIPNGAVITVSGVGSVLSVTNDGHLKIKEGTFGSIESNEMESLEIEGGTFANVPQGAIIPDDLSFIQGADGMWTLQKVYVIDVDGIQYYSYTEASSNIRTGSTVTLLIDGFKPLTIGNGEDGIRNVTIDLNGHYIDCQNTEGITINKGVVATMRDDNPSRTGTMIMNAGNLTITSGTYSLVINYGLGESNVLTIKGGDFIGTEIDGSTSTSLIIGDPMGASTVRITGGTFHGPVMSWDIYPDDGRAPKVYIGGGTFNNVLIGLSGESFDGPTISLEDAGFMISGGKFIEISEDAIQTGYTLRQSEGMYEVVLSESATTSTVTLDSGYADAEEVIIELQNQTIVSDGSNLVIPTLEDGFQNMTVEVDGKKFTTVVEVSNGVIVNDVDMTIPDGTTTIDNQKLESDPTLSKTVVSNVNSILDELDGDGKEVEIVLKPSETENTNQIIAQSGGTLSISIDININTVVNNETAEKRNIESLLEFIIPIPEEDLGKSFLVYRMHETDEGVTEISALPQLSSRNNVTTEGFLVENGYIHIFAQKFSTYTAVTGAETVEDDDDIIFPPWGWDDDDDYVPPIVPSQTEDSGDDNTTSIVACAAAAVVAALMAAYLIIDRRR